MLLHGLELDDGPAKAIEVIKTSDKTIVMIIEEGRNRIVRRMVSAIDNEVRELSRTRIGNINLDIENGKYRNLSKKEILPYV
jgi:pseudouridine synthase